IPSCTAPQRSDSEQASRPPRVTASFSTKREQHCPLRGVGARPGFFAHKVEHESKTQNGRSFQRTGTLAFERVYTANQNCVDAYPTFLVVLWSAGLLCSQVPAAFAGLMYLLVRQKYFVGYLGERTQSTPGYIFGKRIILFLFLMSLAGIFNYYLIFFFGSDFENYIKAVSTTISPLLLIP
uniref:Arachidonate 5-lipoxygenase-activating protein n=1 Tax=Ursus maritimus TaxID=29073 RepID=A0A452URD6_URSMA